MYTVYINHSTIPKGGPPFQDHLQRKKEETTAIFAWTSGPTDLQKDHPWSEANFCRKISYHCNRQKEAWSWKLLQAEKWGLQFSSQIVSSSFLGKSLGVTMLTFLLVVFSGSYDGRHPNGLTDISASCMARCDHGGPSWLGRWKNHEKTPSVKWSLKSNHHNNSNNKNVTDYVKRRWFEIFQRFYFSTFSFSVEFKIESCKAGRSSHSQCRISLVSMILPCLEHIPDCMPVYKGNPFIRGMFKVYFHRGMFKEYNPRRCMGLEYLPKFIP